MRKLKSFSRIFILVIFSISSAGKITYAQQSNTPDPFIGDWKAVKSTYFAQVYRNKQGVYQAKLTTDLISRDTPLAVLTAEKSNDDLTLNGDGWSGTIKNGTFNLEKANEKLVLRPFRRTSPTINAVPPKGAIVLFNGENLDAFTKVKEKDWLNGTGPADNWKILPGGILEVVPHATGEYESIITKRKFGDLKLHVEFRLLGNQTNGGVYLMSRYEMNIKDAYGPYGVTPIGFGNISDPKDLYPDVNVAFPPMQWQTLDIDFRAPRFDDSGTKKTENARITVIHNGVTIYKDVELKDVKGSTAKLGEAGVGPIYLQEHGSPYQFRNIWVIDKTIKGTEDYHTPASPKHGEKKKGGNKKKEAGEKVTVNTNDTGKKSHKKSKGKDVEASYESESNPAYASTPVVTTADASGKPAKPAGFIHPGILVNRAQLAEIRRRVNANVEPQKTAFEKLKNSPLGALDYIPHPVDTVSCGPHSNPDIGCKAEQSDCDAAYSQALLWVITGNKTYAENAIKIMNAWSDMLKGGHNYANGPAQAAWCGSVWPRAAEIIRYTYNGWSDSDILKFQNMLRTQFLPSIIHGDCENGNKELAMSEALVNIGVFNDDRAVFDLGLKMWRGRTPAYIYLKSDGPAPIEPPGCGPAIWGNKGHTPELVDGILQETARDSHHPWMAFSSMTNAAETARQQGVDLYGEEAKRMMAALEFEAQYLPPNNTPAPPNLQFAIQPTWEIAFNEFHNRMGYSLPKMAAVLPTIRPTGANHQMAWETLTHAAMGTIGLPPLKK